MHVRSELGHRTSSLTPTMALENPLREHLREVLAGYAAPRGVSESSATFIFKRVWRGDALSTARGQRVVARNYNSSPFLQSFSKNRGDSRGFEGTREDSPKAERVGISNTY